MLLALVTSYSFNFYRLLNRKLLLMLCYY